jgi:hypothetical protein
MVRILKATDSRSKRKETFFDFIYGSLPLIKANQGKPWDAKPAVLKRYKG